MCEWGEEMDEGGGEPDVDGAVEADRDGGEAEDRRYRIRDKWGYSNTDVDSAGERHK